ncbi:hypothetical protein LOY38_12595 [Pseudomonas sp. B21-015]|nr:hypothetical protein [Pseudomonas sp. B21-015]UVM52799.1 hypothetical protein LOY38_12595 [Pseudomonas sp. B21-015]
MLVLNRVLGNLSVGGKLLLGFGLVLLVTLGGRAHGVSFPGCAAAAR